MSSGTITVILIVAIIVIAAAVVLLSVQARRRRNAASHHIGLPELGSLSKAAEVSEAEVRGAKDHTRATTKNHVS